MWVPELGDRSEWANKSLFGHGSRCLRGDVKSAVGYAHIGLIGKIRTSDVILVFFGRQR